MYARIRARELDPTGRLGKATRGGDPSTSGRRPDHTSGPRLGGAVSPVDQCDPSISLHRGLASWAEADSLSNCTATYSELRPAPRSTIAAAFSPDGRTLASTHGDHTVKLIDCATGKCLATLAGHRRTPWVVRFHPSNPHVLASGSLDHEVRIWNARTSECILRFDFGKPIASLAFHPNGDILTVASGHKLYTWRYAAAMRSDWEARVNGDDTNAGDSAGGAEGADSNTAVNLGDRWTASPAYSGGFPSRSRGTVAGADVGAEGADPDAAALPYISLRTRRSLRAVHFHPHGVPLLLSAEVNDVNPAQSGQSATNEHEVAPLRAVTASPAAGEWETAYAAASAAAAAAMGGGAANGSGIGLSDRSARGAQGIGTGRERSRTTYIAARSAPSNPGSPVLSSQPSADTDGFEEIARLRVRSPMEIDGVGGSTGVPRGDHSSTTRQQLFRAPGGDASASTAAAAAATAAYQSAQNASARLRVLDPGAPADQAARDAAAAAAAAAASDRAADQIQRDQPCTVKLKLWRYDRRNPLAPLSDARLVIPHAVLCSEMGAHFSPCGRLLAACVACLPKDAPEPVAGEPIPRLVYELRVYSLEEKNFGEVLAARSVRAAHCLTSIQFSPTSEHVLLAYGRRHSSLLLLIADGGSCITVHTILEVYRISDMSLVRVLPSAEDEVNVACFHPAAGGGLAYGTKEGRLRILRHDKPPPRNASKRPMAIGRCLEDELLEVLDWSGLDADADGLPVENSGSDTD